MMGIFKTPITDEEEGEYEINADSLMVASTVTGEVHLVLWRVDGEGDGLTLQNRGCSVMTPATAREIAAELNRAADAADDGRGSI
jgi:hypothetical protein